MAKENMGLEIIDEGTTMAETEVSCCIYVFVWSSM